MKLRYRVIYSTPQGGKRRIDCGHSIRFAEMCCYKHIQQGDTILYIEVKSESCDADDPDDIGHQIVDADVPLS